MTRVTTDEVNQAKQVRLIDFIDANGIDVKQEGKRAEPYYRLEDHDSLVIKGEKFFWNSRQEGGFGAIRFAMTYYDLTFPDAVKRVNEHEYAPTKARVAESEKEYFKYPEYFEVSNTENIKEYLVNERKIDSRVIDWCMKKDLLVQDKKDNVVFKWKNAQGEVIGADRQGTKTIDTKRGTFKQVMSNSKKDGGFTIDVGKKPDKVAVFESPIDLLSYWSVKKEQVQNTRLVSMSGLKMNTVYRAVKDLEEKGHSVKQIISCVDNDEAGREFHEKLRKSLKREDTLVDHRPKNTKDWNDECKDSLSSSRLSNQKQTQLGM
ncbi:toprim domain-containing protein [Halalkalibacter lacteus]|uniref:toprim domain-containing protein n=1 Tax=Halalkalibacter lacteus TaxID=3090663 RepID=UPI002FC672E3